MACNCPPSNTSVCFKQPRYGGSCLDFSASKLRKSYFYWWIPDPTFLELQPLQVIYPPHDRIAYSQGDQSSAASAISIDKLVSRDLSILAPNVESFVKNVMVSIEQMNDMLLDQKNTSDLAFWLVFWLSQRPAIYDCIYIYIMYIMEVDGSEVS